MLNELCPALLTEDIINNEASFDGSASSIKIILDFLQNFKKYESLRQRKRQGYEMKSALSSINIKLTDLKEKMKEASVIKVNVSKGLSNVINSAKKKETILSIMLGQANEIKEEVQRSNILNKLKKG